MEIKTTKLCFLLFLLSLFLLSTTFSLAEEDTQRDPRRHHQECQRRCQQQERDPHEQHQCQRRCEDRVHIEVDDNEREHHCQRRCQRDERDQHQRQQCQRRCEERREEWSWDEDQQCQRRCQQHERGQHQQQRCQRRCEERREEEEDNRHDPEREYHECQRRCQQHEPHQQHQCQRRCQEQREHGQGGDLLNSHRRRGDRGHDEEEEEEEEEDNPYIFDKRRLTTRFRTEEGRISVLESFSERSDLLSALENYRLACLEANPNSFVLPTHLDADVILLVLQGN